MTKPLEIVLKPGTRTVRLSDIPALIASALVPIETGVPSDSNQLHDIIRDVKWTNAEAKHKSALVNAIRAGRIVPLGDSLAPLAKSVNEALGLGQIFIETFREYMAPLQISVRSGQIIVDIAESLSQAMTDRHPEKWKHSTDPDPLRRTVVAAINKHGWPHDGIPGVLPFIFAEIEVGTIGAFSVFNDMPCTDVSLIQANPAQWYVTENAARYLLKAMLRFVEGTYALQANDEDSETLAVNSVKSIIYNGSDEPVFEEWAEYPRLTARQAVPLLHGLNPKFFTSNDAPQPPGRARRIPRARELFRVCSHRMHVAEAADIGRLTPAAWAKWATEHSWPVCAGFVSIVPPNTAMQGDAIGARTDAESKGNSQGWRKRALLAKIRDLNYNPLALPPRPKNTRANWVKAEVRQSLGYPGKQFQTGWPGKTFERTWDELRKDKKIVELPRTHSPSPKP